MLGFKSSRRGRTRERSKPAGWDRTRLGVLVPLGVVVAVAIVCIVVAALTSAQRADDVALERERQLLTRAIVNHGEWSLAAAQERRAIQCFGQRRRHRPFARPWSSRGLRAWLSPLSDHDLVLVVDSADHVVYSQPGHDPADAGLTAAATARAQSLVEFMRGPSALMPDGVMRLLGGAPSMRHGGAAAARCSCSTSADRLSVITAIAARRRPAAPVPPPLMLTVRTIEHERARPISATACSLPTLRMIEGRARPAGDNVYEFTDSRNQPIARFAWRRSKPGAEI